MTLFESPEQSRENAAIWRMFSLLPLHTALSQGRIWRWFAINLPMNSIVKSEFTSDIDIIACLQERQGSNEWIYETWEVKVRRLYKDGTAQSLRAGRGKLHKLMNQIDAYNNCGSPCVSLLELFICEAGYFASNSSPSPQVSDAISARRMLLEKKGCGHQILMFEHATSDNEDFGLRFVTNELNPLQSSSAFNLLAANTTPARPPFSLLTNQLDEFFEQSTRPKKSFCQIVFCKSCKHLQLIRMRDEDSCPACGDNLVAQQEKKI
jgi:ribosomal protein S27E